MGIPARAHPGSKFPSRLRAKQGWGRVGGRNLCREGNWPQMLPVASAPLLFSLLISLWFLYQEKFQAVLTKVIFGETGGRK